MRSIKNIKIGVKQEFEKWLEDTYSPEFFYTSRPRIECNDGFSMSVQGGQYAYSYPRENGSSFEDMEIGFPSEFEILIRGYAESNDFTETVYPYVPVSLIIEVIEKHGGMKK